ncbi:MAG: ATP-binding protein [Polyangiaceae bacterium]
MAEGETMGEEHLRELEARVAALEKRRSELEAEVQASRFSEVLLRSILDTVPDFVIKLSPDGIIHFSNRVAPGLDLAEVAGRSIYEFLEPGSVPAARAAIERVMTTGEPASYESVGVGAYHKTARYLTRLAPLRRGEEIESLVMVATDVTPLSEAHASLSESREKLDLALEVTGVGLWSWRREDDAITWDASTRRIFGVADDPPSFEKYLELVDVRDRERVSEQIRRAVAQRRFEEFAHRVQRPDGEQRWVLCKGRVELDATGEVGRLVGAVVDVTERHQLHEQLLQAQKMEAVGQLAAGVAHNFNNMLTVMLSSLELAARRAGRELEPVLREGQAAALRAGRVVRQLMVFAGRSRGETWKVEDLGQVVQRTVEMGRTSFGDEIVLFISVPAFLPGVRCDSGQLEQALLNVLINARDACEGIEDRTPEIRVVVSSGDGSDVRISVSDNGSGMTEEVRRRLFEPFFTTKEPGRGTGLGLATTYAIVHEHGGRLEVESSLGSGTTVHLVLPAFLEASLDSAPVAEASRPTGHGEHVLVVDDEAMIRALMTRLLVDAGYVVDTAVDGIDAVDRVREHAGRYRVVLLDQSMPRLAGRAALRALRGIAPELKIICFSGYPSQLDDADAVLEKPVPEALLLETLARVLASG